MPILAFNNSVPYSEYEMQEHVMKLIAKDPSIQRQELKPVILSEVTIKPINRRSDIIVHFSDRKIVNIECKLYHVSSVITQAKDHTLWANYSVICMPVGTYISTGHQKNMIENGIGLILYSPDGIIEVIYAKYFPKKKDEPVRAQALISIKESYKRQKNVSTP